MDIDGGPELIDETGHHNDVEESSVKTGVSRRGLAILGACLAVGLFGLVRLGADPNARDKDTSIDIQQTEENRSGTDEAGETPTTGRAVAPPKPVRSVELSTMEGAVSRTPIGYSLLLGGDAGFLRVDLDTGVVTRFSRQGWPLLVSGDYVVVQSPSGSVEAIPLSDLDADGQKFPGPASAGLNVTMGPTSGTVWTMPWTGTGEAQLVDLATGNILDRIDLDQSRISFNYTPFGLTHGFGLINGNAGGVYERRDGKFNRLFDGHALVIGENLMLLETCDDELICRSTWYDIAARTPLDLPPIDIGVDSSLAGGDRWAIVLAPDWQAHVVELATGRLVELEASMMDRGLEALAISPDGNWLATMSNGLVITDLNTGERTELSDQGLSPSLMGRYGQVSFVPNESFE